MSQPGYDQCGCCGNLYRSDGSEDQMYEEDHSPCYSLGHDDEIIDENEDGYQWRCLRCDAEGWVDYD